MTSKNEIFMNQGQVNIVGLGLIGSSLAKALRNRGWHVSGTDIDLERLNQAKQAQIIDSTKINPLAELSFIATPVSSVVEQAQILLSYGGIVSDVGGVKENITKSIKNPLFIGGHPMAGSEQEGLQGMDPNLFIGATWVLTPKDETDPDSYARLRSVIGSLGAEIIELSPARHDELVAIVSHVPHLTAATLMTLAAQGSSNDSLLLKLAAGGFRDMTRIAAGSPQIWPDICNDNRSAIVSGLEALIESLDKMKEIVSNRQQDKLLEILTQAKEARRALPIKKVEKAESLVEVKIAVPDRPGVLAEVTRLASDLGVNIEDLEIAHSVEGEKGVLSLIIDAKDSQIFKTALTVRNYHPIISPLV